MIRFLSFPLALFCIFLSSNHVSLDDSKNYVVRINQVPAHISENKEIKAKMLIDKETVGAKEAYLGTLLALPGAKSPVHEHDGAEIIFVLSGEGETTIDGKTYRIEKGSAIYIPPKIKHSFKNTSKTKPMEVIQIYTPPGPEERYRKWEKANER
jgi:quercetin dioxygenase-like cupin family protein